MDNKYKKFDEFLKDNIKNCWDIPGLAIAIFDSNEILYKFKTGYADIKTKQKLKFSDKFCIASCSKSILCATIESLIVKKEIPNIWDMTLDKVWSQKIHKDFYKVTVKQLVMHNSGIDCPLDDVENTPCLSKYKKIEDKLEKYDGITARKKLTNIILKQKPIYEPGSKFEYSNWGYGILGAILEKLTKKHYAKVIEEEVMKPLNIDARYEKLFYGDGYVNGHYKNIFHKNEQDYIPLKKGQYINPLGEAPSGETWMSIIDCANYCMMYLKALNKEKSILNLSTVKKLTKPGFEDYGYGWFINKRKHIYHAGQYFHTSTHFHLVPDKNIGIVLSVNCDFPPRNKWSIVKSFQKVFV